MGKSHLPNSWDAQGAGRNWGLLNITIMIMIVRQNFLKRFVSNATGDYIARIQKVPGNILMKLQKGNNILRSIEKRK